MARFTYEPVDVLKDEEGLVEAPITCREKGRERYFTFSFFRAFAGEDGSESKTPWFYRRHIPAIRRLLERLEDRLYTEIDRNHQELRKG